MKSFRSLKSYKSMNHTKARERGILVELIAAQTLTQARKLMSGVKKGKKK